MSYSVMHHCHIQAGVLGLTKTVAKEFSGRNITCNAIAPGFIASDMTAKIDKKYEEAILKQIPLGMPLAGIDCAVMQSVLAWQQRMKGRHCPAAHTMRNMVATCCLGQVTPAPWALTACHASEHKRRHGMP